LKTSKASAEAYAAGTVVNALSTGKGSAFALNVRTRAEVEKSDELELLSDGKQVSPEILKAILEKLGIDESVKARVESNIPRGSGLGSSSALVNSLILAVCRLFGIELEDVEILRLNAKVSLECGMSFTGAMDDAGASLLGGFVVTDNESMELIRHDVEERGSRAAILLPRWGRSEVSLEKMRSGDTSIVDAAFELAREGLYCEAMKLNSDYCCAILGYPDEPVRVAEKAGLCAGLSGNGPAYVAYGTSQALGKIMGEWTKFGRVILTTIPRVPSYEL